MTILPIGRYRFFQKIQPISLLKQISIQSSTGCLQVFSKSGTWRIYCQQGRVIYASYAEKIFEILYHKLNKYSLYIPTLTPDINQYLHVYFENNIAPQVMPNPDYMAICWLVKHRYINHNQAGILIEDLVLEVLSLLLNIHEGSYDFSENLYLDTMPIFCQLDIKLLVQNSFQRNKHKDYKLATNNISREIIADITNIEQSKSIYSVNYEGEKASRKIYHYNHQLNQKKRERKLYKIVCIDDEPLVLKAIHNFLNEEIFILIGISDPLKALVQLIALEPDLILLDIEMPNLDGYELCSLLRKHPSFRNIPVIMITGRTGVIDKVKAKIVKSSDYLTKPFTQWELLKSIFKNLNLVDEQ